MLGSTIITNALYNIYGDTPAPASIQTRALKELYDAFIKVQRMKDWWFSRATATYNISAAAYTIDISALGIALIEIRELYCTPTGESKYQMTRVEPEQYPFAQVTGHPALYKQTFVDYSSNILSVYPTLDVNCAFELVYRKLYAPTDYASMGAYGDTSANGKYILDILDPYLEALLTSRLCNVLDYTDKAQRYADIAQGELENITKQDWDYKAQEFTFPYGGV